MDVGLTEQVGAKRTTATIDADIGRPHFAVFGEPSISRTGAFFKRVEDVVVSGALILLLCWLLLGVALAIKLTSRGPILFLQERRGRHGVTFRCFKFRSMYHTHADHDCLVQTRMNDPRVTPVGRVIRRYSLDELPQLFNVMLGDMALVGPRPHALGTNLDGRLLHEISPNYYMRYKVKPGITGLAQVNGWRGILDSDDKLNKRLAHDLHYIANWSLLLDLRILLRTALCFTDNGGAF